MTLSPAKINLYLQICGKRADGYHLIDSLMVPLAFGDSLEVVPDNELKLEITGDDALAQEPAEKNLVMKAARALQATQGARMVLHKRIPHAAGLGGGSSNAATALTLLLGLWNRHLEEKQLNVLAASLGADVPFFLKRTAQYAEGIGEVLTPVTLPKLHILLVNPNMAMSTAAVFAKGFAQYSKPAAKRAQFENVAELVAYLKPLSNDLTQHAPREVVELIARMNAQSGCLLARMSGSGATCFGIFENADACEEAARKFPGYWAVATHSL